MGRIFLYAAISIVILLLLFSFIGWLVKRNERREDKREGRAVDGDLNAKQEHDLINLVDDAYRILIRLGVNSTENEAFNDPEIIRESTRTAIAAWTTRYRKVLTK